MFLPLVAIVAALGFWRFRRNTTPGLWTPERAALYTATMRYERDPRKLLYWSKFFAKEGLPVQAQALKNRTQVPGIHGEGRVMRSDIVRRALASNNAPGIAELGRVFEVQGYGATADMLKSYARGIELCRQIPYIEPSPEPPNPDAPVPQPTPEQ
jgi:hypothetical protein